MNEDLGDSGSSFSNESDSQLPAARLKKIRGLSQDELALMRADDDGMINPGCHPDRRWIQSQSE
jgi:hypothetical protein